MPRIYPFRQRIRRITGRSLRFIFTPLMRLYRRFSGTNLLEARIAEQIHALAQEVHNIRLVSPGLDKGNNITEGLRTGYLLSEKLDSLHAEANSQASSVTESLRTSYFLAAKLDLLHADFHHALQKIDRLEALVSNLPVYACSEKLDQILRSRTDNHISNLVSKEIDRLDGYLVFHVEELKALLAAQRSITREPIQVDGENLRETAVFPNGIEPTALIRMGMSLDKAIPPLGQIAAAP